MLLAACQPAPEVSKFSGAAMGASYQVTLAPGDTEVPGDLADQIQAQLDLVDGLMSSYKPHSQLSQLNALPAGQAMDIAPELAEVLAISAEIYRHTRGAFEPTVGPLVDLWGFGAVETGDRVPDDSLIQAAKNQIGFGRLQVAGLSVSKQRPLRIDLSAVAKGYATDKVSEHLEKLGFSNYLVEVGGEMRLSGLKANGRPWRVGIEKPTIGPQAVRIGIEVTDAAVATSGDYRNYFERDGVRYSHTIDPRTGYPVTHKLASVTVIADNCARADAFATGFMVLGEELTLSVAEALNLPVYLLVRQGDQFVARHSSAFEPYLPE